MKRLLSLATLMALGCVLGCGETSKVESSTTVKTPGGQTTTTETTKVEKSGENPPAAEKPPTP